MSVALFDCPDFIDEFRFDYEKLQNSSTAGAFVFAASAGGISWPPARLRLFTALQTVKIFASICPSCSVRIVKS